MRRYLRDVRDHTLRLTDKVVALGELLQNILSVNLTLVNLSQSEQVTKLTEVNIKQTEEVNSLTQASIAQNDQEVGRFEEEGMESFFGAKTARRRRLPLAMRRLIVDLNAEYPGFNPNEISGAVYARFRHWRLYGEEALAGNEAALWLASESLTVEHAGEALSRYAVEVEAATGKLRSVGKPRLFETPRLLPQPRLFGLDALGEGGWLKAMRLAGYAPRNPRRPEGLQQALFAYHEAWG